MVRQDKTFALQSPADFLSKLIFELKKLSTIASDDNPTFFYQAITAASDAWHMCDWVFHALPDAERRQYPRDFQFRDHVKGVCRELAICREIADAAKHSHLVRNPEPGIKTRFLLGVGKLEDAPTTWLVVDGEKILDVSKVIAGAAHYWILFLGEREMLTETPLEEIYRKDLAIL